MTVSEVAAAQPLLDARRRVEQIRTHVEDIKDLIVDAYRARDWETLGYADWSDYCREEFGGTIAIPREERGDVVFPLREAGLSTRAIAAVFDIPRSTANDLAGSGVRTRTPEPAAPTPPAPDPDDEVVEAEIVEEPTQYIDAPAELVPDPSSAPQPEPDRITGTDGKRYKASATPPVRRRRPWPDAYNEAVRKVTAAAVTLQNLTGDDRATKHSSRPYMLNELRRAIESLNATMQVLDQ